MAHTDLVARIDENISPQSNPSTENQEHTVPSQQSRDSTPSLPQAGTNPLPLVGDSLHAKDFRKKLQKSSESHGAVGQLNSIELISKNGTHSAVEGTLIPFIHPSKKE